jgi:hypothetical protein
MGDYGDAMKALYWFIGFLIVVAAAVGCAIGYYVLR